MAKVLLDRVTKQFGSVTAVNDLSIEIADKEFLVLVGVFRAYPWAAVPAFMGIVLVLVYMLRMVQKVLFVREAGTLELCDVSLREGFVLSAFAVIIIFLGVYPAPLLDLVNAPIRLLTSGSGGLP